MEEFIVLGFNYNRRDNLKVIYFMNNFQVDEKRDSRYFKKNVIIDSHYKIV